MISLYPSSSLFSTSFDSYRGANSPDRTAVPNNSFQDMYLLNPFSNYFSNPFSYFPSCISLGVGIYPSGLIGTIPPDSFSPASPWPAAMPILYPYNQFPTVTRDPMYPTVFNPYYPGITQNTSVRYKVVLAEYEDDSDPIYYLMPNYVGCPSPEYAKAYGMPCSIVKGTKYIFQGKTYANFSILASPFSYIMAEMPSEAIE